MALSSRRPVERSITRAAVGLVTAGFLASCGGNTIAGAPVEQTTTSPPASASGEVRLGCGTYCQNAGPLGGAVGPGRESVTIVSSGTVTLDADGYLPVTVTCNLSVKCTGSLVVNTYGVGIGRSDLLVDAGTKATLGVGLPDPLVAYIRDQSPPCRTSSTVILPCPAAVWVLADIGPSFGCAGFVYAPTATGLPPCGEGPVNGFSVASYTDLRALAPG
jgi:hypothetical protein